MIDYRSVFFCWKDSHDVWLGVLISWQNGGDHSLKWREVVIVLAKRPLYSERVNNGKHFFQWKLHR